MRLAEGTVLLNGVAVSEAAAVEFNPPPAADEWEPGALRAVARMKFEELKERMIELLPPGGVGSGRRRCKAGPRHDRP